MKKLWKKRAVQAVCAGALVVLLGGAYLLGINLLRPAELPIQAESSTPQELREVHVSGALEGYSLQELKEKSHLIIVGTLTGVSEGFMIESVPGPSSNFTDYYFTPSQVLRGEAEVGKEVTVRIEGGIAGPYNVVSDVDALPSPNKEYLLFLFQHHVGGGYNTEGDTYWVLGRIQGAYERAAEDSEFTPVSGTGASVDLEALASEMERINREHPVDPGWVRAELLDSLEDNLANGMITQEEHDNGLADLERYATILTNDGTILRKSDTDFFANSEESGKQEVRQLG